MRLVNVYAAPQAKQVLFDLLKEREPHQNISHKVMPSWDEHSAFVDGSPYLAWFVIECDGEFVGSIYLTQAREVGLFIFKQHRGKGYGSEALEMLKGYYPGRMLANVAIRNAESMAFFVAQGFHMLSVTLEMETENARSH